MMGKSTITDGKVDGDNLSFSITAKFQDNEVKLNYKGKVSGDEIHLTSEMAAAGAAGRRSSGTAKRVSVRRGACYSGSFVPPERWPSG